MDEQCAQHKGCSGLTVRNLPSCRQVLPGDAVHIHPSDHHIPMEMRASAQTSGTDLSQQVSGRDELSFLNISLGEVIVTAIDAQTVVNNDRIATHVQEFAENNQAVSRCDH